DDLIEPLPLEHRGQYSDEDAEEDPDHEAHDGERDGGPGGLAEQLVDRLLVALRVAQARGLAVDDAVLEAVGDELLAVGVVDRAVAADDEAADEVPELGGDGLVVSEEPRQLLDLLRGAVLAALVD